MTEVTINGRLICPDAAATDRLRAALAAHVTASRAEPGCLSFEILPTDDPLVWQVTEHFASPAAFEAHKARTAASHWAVAAADIHRDLTILGMP